MDERRWLTVDRGNSTLDCRIADGAGWRRERLFTATGAIDGFVGTDAVAGVAAVSVVPDGLGDVERYCRERGVPLVRAGAELPCPLAVEYDDPAQLGADRWVAAVAAQSVVGDAVVVDAGSAVTVDAVCADGRFRGGVIAPGLAACATGLAGRAPGLPRPSIDDAAVRMLPRSSTDAVLAGVVLGFVALVEGLVDRVAAAAGITGAPIVLTGGNARTLLEHSEYGFTHEPALVHDGLQCLLRNYTSRS